jgi:hypothetical protein
MTPPDVIGGGRPRLPCGRALTDVLAEVAEDTPEDAHPACGHCAEARAELADLWASVIAYAEEPSTRPPLSSTRSCPASARSSRTGSTYRRPGPDGPGCT